MYCILGFGGMTAPPRTLEKLCALRVHLRNGEVGPIAPPGPGSDPTTSDAETGFETPNLTGLAL